MLDSSASSAFAILTIEVLALEIYFSLSSIVILTKDISLVNTSNILSLLDSNP
jgi:hypothetical protein